MLQGFENAQKRLTQTLVGERAEPEGRHHEEQRLSPQQQQTNVAPDAQAVLQQYSEVLVAMVQRELAKKQ